MVSYKQNYPLDINKNSRKHVKVSNKPWKKTTFSWLSSLTYLSTKLQLSIASYSCNLINTLDGWWLRPVINYKCTGFRQIKHAETLITSHAPIHDFAITRTFSCFIRRILFSGRQNKHLQGLVSTSTFIYPTGMPVRKIYHTSGCLQLIWGESQ